MTRWIKICSATPALCRKQQQALQKSTSDMAAALQRAESAAAEERQRYSKREAELTQQCQMLTQRLHDLQEQLQHDRAALEQEARSKHGRVLVSLWFGDQDGCSSCLMASWDYMVLCVHEEANDNGFTVTAVMLTSCRLGGVNSPCI